MITNLQIQSNTPLPEFLLSEKPGILNAGFIVFLVCFFILVYAISRNSRLIASMSDDLFRKRGKRSFSPDAIQYEFGIKLLLSLQALLLFSIILSTALYHYQGVETTLRQFLIYLAISFTGGLAFTLYKVISTNIIGNIFFKKEQTQQWNSNFLSVLSLSGLLLFLPAAVMFYADIVFNICFYFIIFCFFFLFSIVIYRTYVIFFNKKCTLLYFILYLCAQELIPLYLLYKGLFYLISFAQKDALWIVM